MSFNSFTETHPDYILAVCHRYGCSREIVVSWWPLPFGREISCCHSSLSFCLKAERTNVPIMGITLFLPLVSLSFHIVHTFSFYTPQCPYICQPCLAVG
uniref:Uncharacterized protein n=1 Tax=Geospiza parvula TaxID=87175 RepID=A0A8C3N4A0_GEOPR